MCSGLEGRSRQRAQGFQVGQQRPALSPRVRGNRSFRVSRSCTSGSNEAPRRLHQGLDLALVVALAGPNGRGTDNAIADAKTPGCAAEDPRQQGWCCRTGSIGSIPARAGEPIGTAWTSRWSRVYPRACGGTPVQHALEHRRGGLSPRVRGNPSAFSMTLGFLRSIPARAGEPDRPAASRGALCSAVNNIERIAFVRGLSPRVRGNPDLVRAMTATGGLSPRVRGNRIPNIRVYPRACGGTPNLRPRRLRPHGLSPRVRGNPEGRQRHPGHGEGLSPRVRGNPSWWSRPYQTSGSIPARAGEPRTCARGACGRTVYPRAWGEPRRKTAAPRPWRGSIPARAGEPHG